MTTIETERLAVETTSYLQRFTVNFEYPVVFTRGVFRSDNPALVTTIARLEPHHRHRCLVFVDEGLLAVRPSLCEEIRTYFTHHRDRLELVAPPLTVPGGEKIKNDLFHIEWMMGLVFDHRLDRHSFILAVGAAPCSMRSAWWRLRAIAVFASCGCRRRSWPKTIPEWVSRTR